MLRLPAGALRPLLTTTACSCLSTQRNYYSNRPSARPTPSSNAAKPQKTQHNRETAPTILLENRCAQVTTWDLLENSAEAFALVKAVEKKYGPVEDFVFRKDSDSSSTYQTRVLITFRDIESFNRLPVLPEVLHIRSPKILSKRPGGIGLDEIQPLITGDVQFLTPDQVSEMGRKKRSIDFRIQRAENAYSSRSPFLQPPMYQKLRKEIGSKMLQWGGFHEMKPIDSTQPITNRDLTNETLDHVYMRRTLRDWSKVCGEPNPFEIRPKTPEVASTESDAVENEEEKQPKQAPVLDDWFSAVQKPNVVRDPMEQILEMEELQVAKDSSAEPHASNDFQPMQHTSVENHSSETISTPSLDDTPFGTLPSSEQFDLSQTNNSEPETKNNPSPSSSSPSITSSVPFASSDPDPDVPQFTPLSLDSVVSPASSLDELKPDASPIATEAESQHTKSQDDLKTLADEYNEELDIHVGEARKMSVEGAEDVDFEQPRITSDSHLHVYSRLQDILKNP